MYSGYQYSQMSKSISYSSSTKLLNEPNIISMQREVDNYTRKLEQEKRRLFSIEETYEIILKEYKDKKLKVTELQKQSHTTETKLVSAKIKNLEKQIESAISKYNQVMSENDQLKSEIDMMRKERASYKQICENLSYEVTNKKVEAQQIQQKCNKKQTKTYQTKNQIIMLCDKNDEEKKEYFKQFVDVQNEAIEDKKTRDTSKIVSKKEKYEIIDVHSILKHRLKKLIANNKEKVKVIEQYQKNLKIIDEAFNQIKEGSGITDIEEITNTFIKSEEQNYSLYNYVDILNQDIDNCEEMNKDLEKKCQEQEEKNDSIIKQMRMTPRDEQTKKNLNNLIKKKEKTIEDFRTVVKDLKPLLEQILIDLAKSKFNPDEKKLFDYQLGFDLTEVNLEQYLSDVEYYINILIEYKNAIGNNQSSLNHTLLVDQIPQKEFKQSKPYNIQLTHEELQSDAQKLLDHEKLKEIAIDQIEKKKIHKTEK